jgi:hypothetical protein
VGVVTRSAAQRTQREVRRHHADERERATKNDAGGCPRFVGRSIVDFVPRLRRCCGAAVALALCAVAAAGVGCTTVDPGPDFVIPVETFDANYFYCHVEPQVLTAKKCGPGDPALGDPANGCHFNSAAVSGMALIQHPVIDCGGGDEPLDSTQVGEGSPAQSNLQAASLEMSRDYLDAPIVVRPTGHNHPRAVYTLSDPVVSIIGTWASK